MTRTQDAFLRFHAGNPHIYDELEQLALQWQATRGGRQSIQLVYGALRWERFVSTTEEPYLLNDHFQPFYARLLMDRNPALIGAFETRASEADILGALPHPDQVALWDAAGVDLTWLDEANRLLDEPESDDLDDLDDLDTMMRENCGTGS